ncbi:MAG: YHS domain-containing (seleno)protein [Phycisphaerae bacterium]
MTTREARRGLIAVITGLAGLAFASPAPGGPPADFALKSGQHTFRLSEARGGYVALHFLLKTECPYCAREVRDYAERSTALPGVTHVFIKPDSDAEIAAFAAKLDPAVRESPIYRDADDQLAKAFEIPDGFAFHGTTTHYPALVLLGPDGRELFRHVGRDNADRLAFEQFAARYAEISRTPALGQYNLAKDGVALQGYDPVSYATGAPKKGDPRLRSDYRGVTYQFADAAHRERFAREPERFAPAYGGWCATAMAEGRKVEVDPLNYKIVDGRLMLFYKGWLGDALKDWNQSEPKLRAEADAAWSKLAPGDALPSATRGGKR